MRAAPTLWVLAGVNGAGKSSIGGAMLRAVGADYFNPDEWAQEIRRRAPGLTAAEANARAWSEGKRLLEAAIARDMDYAFESTLGGATIPRLLEEAAARGFDIHVWFIGLEALETHFARVAARVAHGGHGIPQADIRRRFDASRRNLIRLLPVLASLRLFDNSPEADPAEGRIPRPKLLLHLEQGRLLAPAQIKNVPDWARPIVAAVLKLSTGALS